MDDEAQIHQTVPDNGVRHEGDKDQAEVGTDPTVRRATCNQRSQKVDRDGASAGPEHRRAEILELSSLLSARTAPFLETDPERKAPSENEVQGKDRVERTRPSCYSLIGHKGGINNQRANQREKRKGAANSQRSMY
jgi:hypothetical protein